MTMRTLLVIQLLLHPDFGNPAGFRWKPLLIGMQEGCHTGTVEDGDKSDGANHYRTRSRRSGTMPGSSAVSPVLG
jgi:hypothetical protein